MDMIDRIKKMREVTGVAKKDSNLKDLFKGEEEIQITVTGLSSKFVPKYKDDDKGQLGYFTMLETKEHGKVGAFSNALYYFADFYYQLTGVKEKLNFRKIEFDGELIVKVSIVKLDGGKSTYNFEEIGGEINGARNGMIVDDTDNQLRIE